ncbi:UBX domain-containing protein [Hypomontagnella monticulosa]|nr:UBX domain-containing protein [Hypomontagnella monticulosa]
MASNGDLDISRLTPEQQAALEQYTQVTAQDIKDAVPLLERSQWNVQIAIAKFFDGEGPDPVAEAMNDIPRQAARHENLQESFTASSQPFGRPPRRARPDPAPRIVPQPTTTHRPPLLLAIIFAPFNFGYKALSTFFRTLMYVFAFLPASIRPRAITTSMTSGWKGSMGRRMLMPRDTAARFKREFEEEYGSHSLPFYEGGFAQALDLAKKDLKFLLIVLMSPEHDDTESFTRETLLSPEVISFINEPDNNIIMWGGNVLDSEAYQVAAEYNCTKFPFSCLVCLTPKEGSSTRMSIVKRLVGPMSSSAYLAELQTAVNKYAPDLAGVRAERAAQDMARNLRSEQDSAYERSLARDRERARQRREAEAAAALAEQHAKEEAAAAERRAAQREQWRHWRAGTIAPEPTATDKDVVRLALKLPDSEGGRIVRKFAASTTVEELYAFVECYNLLNSDGGVDEDEKADRERPEGYEHEYKFRIATPLPRVVYDPNSKATLGAAIGRSGNLIVEDVIHDEESDDDSDEQGVE